MVMMLKRKFAFAILDVMRYTSMCYRSTKFSEVGDTGQPTLSSRREAPLGLESETETALSGDRRLNWELSGRSSP
jgi:hypothetical protein